MTEVEQYEAVRFRCGCCKKSWASKTRARRHVEAGCIHDPAVRACATCEHDVRGHPGGFEEMGEDPYCAIGARAAFEDLTRQCDEWSLKPWLRTKASR